MTSTEQVGWRPPAGIWHRVETHVVENWTDEAFYYRRVVEEAMREYIDQDGRLAGIEDLLRRATDLEGLSSSTDPPGTDRFQDADTRLVNIRVDADLKADFKAFAVEHDVSPGRMLGMALDAYLDGGRLRRVERDLERLLTDAPTVVAETAAEESEESPSRPDADLTLAVVDALGDWIRFTREDVAEVLADHGEADPGPDLLDAYAEAVASKLDRVEHPTNPDLYIPEEERADLLVYEDLSREARGEELARHLALDAVQAGKEHAALSYSEVQDLFERICVDNGSPSHQYAYDLMGDVAGIDGYSYGETREGQNRLQVDVPETPARIKEWLADHPAVDLGTEDAHERDDDAHDGEGWVERAVGLIEDKDLPPTVGDPAVANKIARAQDPALLDADRLPTEAVDAVTAGEIEQVRAALGWDGDAEDGEDTEADAVAAVDAEADRLDAAQAVRTDGGTVQARDGEDGR